MKKLSLYIFLILMFCNVGFAKDLTGLILSCDSQDKRIFPENPNRWDHLNFLFISDKNVIVATFDNFEMSMETYGYKVDPDEIKIEFHYYINRSTLRTGSRKCTIIEDENFDIKKDIEEKLQEALDAQKEINKI